MVWATWKGGTMLPQSYFICEDCATTYGGRRANQSSSHAGPCFYCGSNEWLSPIRDWEWSARPVAR